LFGAYLPPVPHTSLSGRACSALIFNFVEEEDISIVRKTEFLLVEIRTAIQRES
jgi:hypothetical protein